jgi:hypothetical protein
MYEIEKIATKSQRHQEFTKQEFLTLVQLRALVSLWQDYSVKPAN